VPATAPGGFCQDFLGAFGDVGLTAVVLAHSWKGRPFVLTRVLAQNVGDELFYTSTLRSRHCAELEGGIGIKIDREYHRNNYTAKSPSYGR
jgi:hypothetical protein